MKTNTVKSFVKLIYIYIKLIYIYIKKKDSRDWILCWGCLGDACYNLAYSKWIIENLPNAVFCVDSKHKKLIVDHYMFIPSDKIIYYSGKSFLGKCLNSVRGSFFVASSLKRMGIYNFYPYTLYSYNSLVTSSYLEYYRKLLGIPDSTVLSFPQVDLNSPVVSIDSFKVKKGKIIVINPFSNSMGDGYIDLWEDIADSLIQKGYILYTNVVGEQKPVKGTLPLKCSIEELYVISSQIPLVISIRSGIVDFCVSSGGDFYVIYFNNSEGLSPLVSESMKYIYRLSDWGTNNVIESYYELGNKSNEISEILSFVESKKSINAGIF